MTTHRSEEEFSKEYSPKGFAEKMLDTETVWKASPEEPYGLRRFNSDNPQDTEAYTNMDRHPEVIKYMDPKEPSAPETIDTLINLDETDSLDPRLLFAIVDNENRPVGWVMFYAEDKGDPGHNDERRLTDIKQGLAEMHEKDAATAVDNIPDDALVLEVSYSKLFTDWPKYSRYVKFSKEQEQPKGVAISGLRQGLQLVAEMELRNANAAAEEIEKQKEAALQKGEEYKGPKPLPPRRVFITAHTDPENRASEIVLERNGFVRLPNMVDYEDGDMNYAWVKEVKLPENRQ